MPVPTTPISRPVVAQPTPEAQEAIREFVAGGTWPKPGTMPICIRLGRSGHFA